MFKRLAGFARCSDLSDVLANCASSNGFRERGAERGDTRQME